MTGGPSTDAGVIEAAGRVRGGEWTSVGLVAACLDRIDALEPTIEAWVHVDARAALAEARERDAAVAEGVGGALDRAHRPLRRRCRLPQRFEPQ